MNTKILLSIIGISALITTGPLFASSPTYYDAADSDITSYRGINPDREYRAAQVVDSMDEVTDMNKSFFIRKKIVPKESSSDREYRAAQIVDSMDEVTDMNKSFFIRKKIVPKESSSTDQ